MLCDPIPLNEKREQFSAVCKALGLVATDSNVIDQLRDKIRFPAKRLIEAVETLGSLATIRSVEGPSGGGIAEKDSMEWQRQGGLGTALRAAGVKCVVVGDVRDEVCHFEGGPNTYHL